MNEKQHSNTGVIIAITLPLSLILLFVAMTYIKVSNIRTFGVKCEAQTTEAK